ncbi:hypothetical protein GOP47_0021170, partial [Adiantum capillus-veneris]
NFKTLEVVDCESVEELPSLSPLVGMVELHIEKCEKLRSIDGCKTMENLAVLYLIKCRSLECFLLDIDGSEYPPLVNLNLRGSKCARLEHAFPSFVQDKEFYVCKFVKCLGVGVL